MSSLPLNRHLPPIDLRDIGATWRRYAEFVANTDLDTQAGFIDLVTDPELESQTILGLTLLTDPVRSVILVHFLFKAMRCVVAGEDPTIWHPLLMVTRSGVRLDWSRSVTNFMPVAGNDPYDPLRGGYEFYVMDN